MITMNFYKDGTCITGHDINEICTLVSYAMWACIEDCLNKNDNVHYYESCYDNKWKNLGLSYIKIDTECPEHLTIFERFKDNITRFVSRWDDIWDENGKKLVNCEGRKQRVKINYYDEYIDWDTALQDAKQRA